MKDVLKVVISLLILSILFTGFVSCSDDDDDDDDKPSSSLPKDSIKGNALKEEDTIFYGKKFNEDSYSDGMYYDCTTPGVIKFLYTGSGDSGDDADYKEDEKEWTYSLSKDKSTIYLQMTKEAVETDYNYKDGNSRYTYTLMSYDELVSFYNSSKYKDYLKKDYMHDIEEGKDWYIRHYGLEETLTNEEIANIVVTRQVARRKARGFAMEKKAYNRVLAFTIDKSNSDYIKLTNKVDSFSIDKLNFMGRFSSEEHDEYLTVKGYSCYGYFDIYDPEGIEEKVTYYLTDTNASNLYFMYYDYAKNKANKVTAPYKLNGNKLSVDLSYQVEGREKVTKTLDCDYDDEYYGTMEFYYQK